MNNGTIEAQIKNLELRIESLREVLPYADGQAYYDDKRKIDALTTELAELERHL